MAGNGRANAPVPWTPERRALAMALRELSGLHLGMLITPVCPTSKGGVIVSVEDGPLNEPQCAWVCAADRELYWWGAGSTDGLPDLEAETNHGVWRATVEAALPELTFASMGPGSWRIVELATHRIMVCSLPAVILWVVRDHPEAFPGERLTKLVSTWAELRGVRGGS